MAVSLPTPRPPTPLLQPWGPLAATVARLVQHAPHLATRLLLLPARGLHATCIALHAANDRNDSDTEIATRLSQTHPRDLLREAMPNAPPELYQLLDRASIPAWPRETYWELERLLGSRVSSSLTGGAAISPERVESATALLEANDIVWRSRKAYRYSHERQHLSTVVEVLRSLGLLRDLTELPDGAGRAAVFRRVRADLARGHCAERDFPTIAGWSKIETVGALWEIGARLQNCVRPGQWGSANYALGMIAGRHVFFHHSANDLLAHMRHVTGNLWVITQIAGAKNVTAPGTICAAFEDSLRAGGLLLVPTQPSDAIQSVLQRNRALDGLLGDAEGGADVDIAA